jgi:16S rRNA (uracil1498-N3)-methyltransferase
MDDYRFYVPDLLAQVGGNSGGVELPEDQSHHARTVLRLAGGERVVVFDGAGGWATGIVHGDGGGKSRGRGRLGIAVEGGVHVDPPPFRRLTIATAVPKGERAEWLIEQVSQLNAACVQWIDCDRSVVKPREGGQKIDKWRRSAIESAKQCGRTHLMRVEEPLRIERVLEKGGKVLWLEPREGEQSQGVREVVGGGEKEIVALVGPEGGWSEREWGLLEKAVAEGRVTRMRLMTTVLRIETACAAIAAIVMSQA